MLLTQPGKRKNDSVLLNTTYSRSNSSDTASIDMSVSGSCFSPCSPDAANETPLSEPVDETYIFEKQIINGEVASAVIGIH